MFLNQSQFSALSSTHCPPHPDKYIQRHTIGPRALIELPTLRTLVLQFAKMSTMNDDL